MPVAYAKAQIAATTISMIQYNLLATVKRFEYYESLGALFKAAGVGASEATITQCIWYVINVLIIEIASFFNKGEEILINKYLNDTETFTKTVNLETLHKVG